MNARVCLLALATACAGDPDGGATDTLEFMATDLAVPAGADVTYCTYIDSEVTEDRDILAYQGQQSEFGHHTILFGVRARQPPGTHECTEADMINVRYLAGAGAETGYSVPDGIAFRLSAGQQLMIQSHFINTGERDVVGHSHFMVDTALPDPARQIADLFVVVSTDIEVPARSAGSATVDCPVGKDLSIIQLGGHAHEWGTRVSIARTVGSAGEAEMLYDEPWNPETIFNPVVRQFTVEEPLVVAAGDRITLTCDYQNDTDEPLTFPKEMCVSFAFYFPAEREIDCVDGHWPGS
jgi:hypothetical protein